MGSVLGRLYGRLGGWYFVAYAIFEAVSALAVTAGAIAIIGLYGNDSTGEYLHILLVAWACVAVALSWGAWKVRRFARPLLDWRRSGCGRKGAVAAWRTAIGLPVRFVEATAWLSIFLVALPVAVWATLEYDISYYNGAIIFAASLVAIAYAVILHFFASEMMLRPAVRQVAAELPDDFDGRHAGTPLRWRLLAALPLINVITGVVVAGLTREAGSLRDLGADVILAVGVAFSLSLALTLLVARSVVAPVRELLAATERVQEGDLSARVPLTSGDELGTLSSSFNTMLVGLGERATLREALGTYVNPEIAERVLEEGTLLEGDEVEVTILFIDIRDFTSFAERAEAREIVAYLNEFFGHVVPILTRHGGHVDKFVGDGALAVFGFPEPSSDHADRGLAAAREIAATVERVYGDRLSIGIGVNSGNVLAGAVGGGGRLDLTVIGDPVNVASRIEAATRDTGDTILFTEATRSLLRGENEFEDRGSVPLRGKLEPTEVYAPADTPRASRAAASPPVSR